MSLIYNLMRSWRIIQELSKAFHNKLIPNQKLLDLMEFFLPFLLNDAEKQSNDRDQISETLLEVMNAISSVMEQQLLIFLEALPQQTSNTLLMRCFTIQKTITLKCSTILDPMTISSGYLHNALTLFSCLANYQKKLDVFPTIPKHIFRKVPIQIARKAETKGFSRNQSP